MAVEILTGLSPETRAPGDLVVLLAGDLVLDVGDPDRLSVTTSPDGHRLWAV